MKKRTLIAVLIMLVLLLVALPVGVHRTYAEAREEADSVYHYDEAGINIYLGVSTRHTACEELIDLAGSYVEQTPTLQLLVDEVNRAVRVSRSLYISEGQRQKEAQANRDVSTAFDALYSALQDAGLKQEDMEAAQKLAVTMETEQTRISRSGYNKAAAEFNASLEVFPINYLRYVAMIQPLELFE